MQHFTAIRRSWGPNGVGLLVVAITLALSMVPREARAQSGPAVSYRVTVPEPEHHWLQIEVTFPGLGSAPLRARMSRSSPGRYAVHEFAKNVFSVEAYTGAGRRLPASRPDVDEWRVTGHDGTVRIVYRIFGDHADGTYMAVDTTHAHLNMPATFIWAMGLEDRPIEITFTPPAGSGWTVGTQLFPTTNRFAFTAPNLQYFMDSPTELARLLESAFSVAEADGRQARFRILAHADAAQADVDALATLVARLVREQRAVFGEFPRFEPGHYTFLLDYVAWADGDAMEHRNSTYISQPGVSLRTPAGRLSVLETISHEFFHVWNVERIRPAGLEPFDFTRENITCCLWLAEGFTEYYGPLALRRAGLASQTPFMPVVALMNGPARQVRSAVEMSEHGPFADAGVANDVDDRSRTFLSYYSVGAAIAMGLDLSIREQSQGRLSLDDYMRRLWDRYGAVAAPAPGHVARPYTLADLRRELGDLTGDVTFANTFFDRYVEGRELMDYTRLLALSGYAVRPVAPERAWLGRFAVQEEAGGLLVGGSRWENRASLVPFGTPAYTAGLDRGDLVVSIDDQPATTASWEAIGRRRPGDRVRLTLVRRDGTRVTTTVVVEADPTVQIVPGETVAPLSASQRAFRDAWMGTKVR